MAKGRISSDIPERWRRRIEVALSTLPEIEKGKREEVRTLLAELFFWHAVQEYKKQLLREGKHEEAGQIE